MTAALVLDGSDLASRDTARKYRELLFEAFKKHQSVEIDVGGVLSMSHGFADELFAVSAVMLGIDEFLTRVYIINDHDRRITRTIAEAIRLRKVGFVNPNVDATEYDDV